MWKGRPAVVEMTALTVQEGCRAVAQVVVHNHGEAREWDHPNLHHVSHQLFGVARGHNVWYSE